MRVALMMHDKLVFTRLNDKEWIVACDTTENPHNVPSTSAIVKQADADQLSLLYKAYNCATNHGSASIVETAINQILDILTSGDVVDDNENNIQCNVCGEWHSQEEIHRCK